MNLSSPEKSITLSDEETQAIEEAKNRVTLLDAESSRLMKLAKSTEKEIRALHTEKTILENELASLKETREALTIQINESKLRWEEQEKATRELFDKAENSRKAVEQANQDLKEREQKINIKEDELSQKEITLQEMHKELTARKTSLDKSVDMLINAIQSISL